MSNTDTTGVGAACDRWLKARGVIQLPFGQYHSKAISRAVRAKKRRLARLERQAREIEEGDE